MLALTDLHHSIDSKSLYNLFSKFGNILSCKLETREDGSSLGIGYVHFDTQQSADLAIQKVNGMLLNGKRVYVDRFRPFWGRKHLLKKPYVHIYMTNPDDDFDLCKLLDSFEQFGRIADADYLVRVDQESARHGVGFVGFESHEAAANAVKAVNGSIINGRRIYCGWVQKEGQLQYMHLAVQGQHASSTSPSQSWGVQGQHGSFPMVLSSRSPWHCWFQYLA